MTENIKDKLIKLGVSYYDGTVPAAPPIRGINGLTEGYNQVITDPYGEQGVTPSPVQGTLDNLPVQSAPVAQQQGQMVSPAEGITASPDVVGIPVVDEPVNNNNSMYASTDVLANQPIQPSVQNTPTQEVPYNYKTLQQQLDELNTIYTPEEVERYYSTPSGLMEKRRWLKTGDPEIDSINAIKTTGGNIIPSLLQLGTGIVASVGLINSAYRGFQKSSLRVKTERGLGKKLDEATWAKFGLDINDPDIQTFISMTKPVNNIISDIRTGNKSLKESYNENIAQPLADMLDYSFISPKLWISKISGDIDWKQFLELSMNRLVENPVDNLIDLGTAGLAAAPRSVVNVGKLLKAGKVGEAAQITKDLARVKAAQSMEPVAEAAENLAKGASKESIANVIKSAEEGGVHLTQKDQALKAKLKDMMTKYHNILEQYGLEKDPMMRTVAQYITRKTGITHDEALKSILPFFENSEFVNFKPSLQGTTNYLINLYSKVTGIPVSEARMSLRGIKVAKAEALPHQLVRKIINEATITPTAEAQGFIKELKNAIFDKAGYKPSGEVMNYALDNILGIFTTEQLENMKIPGVNPNSPMFKDAVQFWRNKLLDKKVSGKTTLTEAGREYIQHNKRVNPSLELLEQGLNGYNSGDLFPVTHVNADKAQLISEGKTAGLERFFAGEYSDMVNGLASYEGMAEQFANPNYLTWQMGTNIEQKVITNKIKTLAEEVKATGNISSNTKWINPEELDNIKNIGDVSSKLVDTPARPDYLPISPEFVNRLIDTVEISNDFSSPYRAGSFPDKAYKFFRQFALSKGMYLSGNVASSTYQTLMNSNINLLRDLNDTFKTQGRLSRIAGTARPVKPFQREAQGIVGKFYENTMKPITSTFQYIDTKQQNMASEIALNNYLAEKGIPVQQRVNYLKNIKDPTVITEMIERAQDAAGLNTGFYLLPKQTRPIVAMLDPFWRWKDTATRSTIRGIKRQPILNNLVLHKGLGMLAFNQEMQHRMRVQADTNKPLVHIMYNPKTGMFRDQSAIWSAQAQSVELLGGVLQSIKERNIQPAIEKALPNTNPVGFGILYSLKGKDVYGNPLYREETLGGNPVLIDYNKKQRYEITPEGEAKPLATQADEVIAQLIRNTVAPVGLVDDTGSALLQAGASSLGYDINKYNPNGNAITGSLNANALWANPNSPRTPDMAINRLLGMYTTPEYDPLRDYEKLTPRQRVRLMKQRTKQMNKRLINRNIYGGR